MSNIIEIPRYQSNKPVQALKIKHVIENPRGVELHFENERYCPIQMPAEWALKYVPVSQRPALLAGGYVVWHQSGPATWISGESFESGYTAIGQHDSDCSTNNHGVPEQLGPCDCLVSASKQTCTDELLMLDTSRISAEDLEALKAKLRSLRDNAAFATPVLAAPMLTQAAKDVLAERRRQVEAEGWTPEHDDKYPGGQLACAAIAYLMVGVNPNGARLWWPWDVKTFKPSPDTRRNLIKAGALLLADIEWLDRLRAKLAEPAKQEPLAGQVCSKVSAVAADADDLTKFLEQTDFDAAEKVASDTVANQRELPAGEDDCEGCKI